MFQGLVRTENSPAQFFIRLALGIVMLPHGLQKVLGWFGGPGFAKTLHLFAGMGFSTSAAIAFMAMELVGSTLLVIGFLTRLWALGLGVTLTVSMFMSHTGHGFFMNWSGLQQGEGIEYHILAMGIALALLLRGGGMLSVDRVLTRDRRKGRVFY